MEQNETVPSTEEPPVPEPTPDTSPLADALSPDEVLAGVRQQLKLEYQQIHTGLLVPVEIRTNQQRILEGIAAGELVAVQLQLFERLVLHAVMTGALQMQRMPTDAIVDPSGKVVE